MEEFVSFLFFLKARVFFLVQIKGWYGVIRTEEKVSMYHFKEINFGWKIYLFGIGDPKMVLKLS